MSTCATATPMLPTWAEVSFPRPTRRTGVGAARDQLSHTTRLSGLGLPYVDADGQARRGDAYVFMHPAPPDVLRDTEVWRRLNSPVAKYILKSLLS